MANQPVTLEMIALLLEANKDLQEANHKSTNDKIDAQNVTIQEMKTAIKEIKSSVGAQCDTCSKIGDIKTTLGYHRKFIGLLGLGLSVMAKLGYDFQGKILEFIGGVK